ncbi:MAG: ADP-ribosylglycohydrolase family protein [Coleofasciculus sp. C1-SOL-03]|jgi:hypothetical protein|uniref:ADP-ribosylglycohydrolase family protein n=1 Tax=Coleofasciculus sp. C1-SOL-03 TaxID=3069522 RepID=UPI0032F0E3CA
MTQYPHNFNNNTQLLHWLFRAKKIDLNWGRLFEQEPISLPPAMNWNRIEGMILGLNPEAAIVRAVNDTEDNDTIAAIVGAAVGALHGKDALPQRWRVGLLGRTAERDDGTLWRVLETAYQIWWHP